MSSSVIFLSVVVAGIVVWAYTTYNRLIRLRNQMRNAFSQIDVQLKRRHDLIPTLVETARGYLKHERQTLEAVTLARQRASEAREAAAAGSGKADLIERLDRAEAGLAGALGKFSLVVEAYPQLQADKTIASLTEELTTTENRIGFSRQAFNDSVNGYNDGIEQFPGNLIASAFGFEQAGHLRSTRSEKERQPVAVNLT